MSKKSLLMMLLMAIFAPWVANAETIVEIGNGTSQDYYVPISTSNNDSLSSCNSVSFNTLTNFRSTVTDTLTVFDGTDAILEVPAFVSNFNWFTRSQFVIPADDLSVMDGSTISSMKFYTEEDDAYTTASTVDVYLMEVNYTTLNAYEPKESGTIVYQGTLEFVGTLDGELTINFTRGYKYHGGNLLIGIENTTNDDGYVDILFYGQIVEGASGAGLDLFSLEDVLFTQQDFIPKTTFTYIFGQISTCLSPTNLTVSEVTSQAATLTWSTGASTSVLEYGTASDFTGATSISVSGTTANLSGLTPGTTYYARVKAVCGGSDGESPWSSIRSFTTPFLCPIPMNLAATLTPGDVTIATLTWSTDASASVLEYGTASNFTGATSMSVSGTTANLTGLTPGTTYYARVKAVCGGNDGESPWSSTMSFTTLIPCPIPMNLAATLTPGDVTIATLTWSTDASTSVLEYGTASDFTGATSMSVSGTIANLTGLTPGTTYYARVKAVCGGSDGESPWSSTMSFTTLIPCPIPMNLAATLTYGDGTIATLTWSTDASASVLEYGTASDFTGATSMSVSGTIANLTGLTPETTYYARVKAVCGGSDGESPWSSTINFTPTDYYRFTVYDGTVFSLYVPAVVYYFDYFTRSQFIIPADDLSVMDGGTISSMKFYTYDYNIPYTTASTVDVYLMEVDYTTLSAYEPKESGTIVYQGTLEFVSSDGGGELTINFNPGYTYNGGNLLIGIENTTNVEYTAIHFYGQTVEGASGAASSRSSLQGVPFTQRDFIPKTTFTYIPGEPSPCPRPTDLTVSNVVAQGATLTWSTDASASVLEYGTAADFTGATSMSVNGTIANLTGLTPETTYYARVKAVCGGSDGESPWSSTINFTPTDNYRFTVYDGTVTSVYVPAYVYYFDDFTRSQFVIPADDLSVMDGFTISSMKFYTTSTNIPYTTVSAVDVYLMEVDYTTLSAYEPKESGTIVYQGLLEFVSSDGGGELTINFDPGYNYNGGNLLIGIENTTNVGWKNIYFYGQTVEGASGADSSSSSLQGVPFTQCNFIPKTTFTYKLSPCPIPTDLTVSNVNPQGATLTWSTDASASVLEYGTAADFTGATSISVSGTIANLTGLTPEATYYARVKAVCGGNDGESPWSNVFSFVTECGVYTVTEESYYTYDFETTAPFDCWTPIAGVTFQTNSSYFAHEGTCSLRFSGTTDNMVALPQFENATNTLRLEFWTRPESYSYANCGTFSVGYMTDLDDIGTFVEVASYDHSDWSITTYEMKTVDFGSAPADAYIVLRHNPLATNFYWYVDDVTVKPAPPCLPPIGFAVVENSVTAHQATLEWMGYSDSYTVSYRTKAYVEDGVVEGFGTSIPSGWSQYVGRLSEVMEGNATLSNGTQWYFASSNGVFDHHARINIYGVSRRGWLVTPEFIVPAGADFNFDLALTAFNGTDVPAPETTGIDDRFVVLISTDDMGTWTILREWNNSGSNYVYNNIANTATGENVSINISAYVGQNVRIAFYGESTVKNADNNLHIDNVFIGHSVPAGAWQTVTVEEMTATLTGLTPKTLYEAKLQGDCGSDGLSEETGIIFFQTLEAWPGDADEYIIHNTTDWDLFCEALEDNATYNRFVGKTVKLDADISVTRMAGSSGHGFGGTFDGQGHTLTVDYTTTAQYTAPFRYVNGATIMDLTTGGTISTSAKFAGGMVGQTQGGTIEITNCVSGVTINSSVNGDGTHGGFVALASYGTLNFTGCMFSGEMLGASTTLWGGFVGWTESNNNATATFTDCLFNPTNLTINNGRTFARARNMNSVTITNSFYIVSMGAAQGHPAVSDPNLHPYGDPTGTYPVSDLTAYANGLKYGEVFYYNPESIVTQTVALTAGTNWFSTYLDISLEDLQTALAAATPENTITIKSSSGNSVYTKRTHSWNTPASFVWDVAMKYDIVVAADCQITLQGMPINPAEHPITILGHGSTTWIGFPFTQNMTLAEAFAQIVLNGDKVKSSNGNATYTRGNWNGNFSTLETGKGYLYVSPANAADRTFTFPTSAK